MADSPFSLLKSALIFLGAGCGGVLRYWLGGIVQAWWGPTFPMGTLVVNVTGCLAIGFLATAWSRPTMMREEFRQAVLIGIIGGYSTFSSFSRETVTLLGQCDWLRAGAYVVMSVALGLLAVWLGGAAAARLCRF